MNVIYLYIDVYTYMTIYAAYIYIYIDKYMEKYTYMCHTYILIHKGQTIYIYKYTYTYTYKIIKRTPDLATRGSIKFSMDSLKEAHLSQSISKL